MKADDDPRRLALDAWNANSWVRPGRSSIADVGLIAVRDIPPGTVIWDAPEEPVVLVGHDTVLRLPRGVREIICDYFAPEPSGRYLPLLGPQRFDLISLVNHAAEPNSTVSGNALSTTVYVAAGEEITIRYDPAAVVRLVEEGRWGEAIEPSA